ncbi:MAG: hypothetical protein M5T52_23990 [Ignavibacteriaceae bacterium]|nr:hypothetical protein [Ignavibacteriaceae bacterium]
MDQDNYSRGSEWSIWDLQVQSILDNRYEQLKDYYQSIKTAEPERWDQFVQKVGGETNALLYDSKEYFSNESIDKKKDTQIISEQPLPSLRFFDPILTYLL